MLMEIENKRLEELEGIIQRGLETFVEVGQALSEIRDGKLYKADHSTFEDYCRERWGMTRAFAYYQINAAQTVKNLSTMVDNSDLPQTERQARPLSSLEPDQQREAWQEAVRRNPNGDITAKKVEQVVNEFRQASDNTFICDECGEVFGAEVWHCPGCDHHYSLLYDRECGNCHEYEQIGGDVKRKELYPSASNAQMLAPHVSHNSGENEWYTPIEYIQAAQLIMGGIDLDPASTLEANQVVEAKQFYSKETNGLTEPWYGKIWLNPPYSTELISDFIDKLIAEYPNIDQAIVLVNNATETKWFSNIITIANVLCFPTRRVRFWEPGGKISAPLQGQTVIGINCDILKFRSAFNDFGWTAIL